MEKQDTRVSELDKKRFKKRSRLYTFFYDEDPFLSFLNITIIASSIIIAAVIFVQSDVSSGLTPEQRDDSYVRPIDKQKDIIFGNPNAKVFIVEYGDLECPFCQAFHPTMRQFMADNGVTGDIAWVWRHGTHINVTSIEKAETVECVRLVTDDVADKAAWDFIGLSLEGGVLEEEYPAERYENIFTTLDIDSEAVQSCRKEGVAFERLQDGFEDVVELDITETPFIQFIANDGTLLFEQVGELQLSDLQSIIQTIFTSAGNN